MIKYSLLFFVIFCSFGCKQRRTDAPTTKEKIVVSPAAEGKKGEIFSERFGELHVSVPEKDVRSAVVIFSDNTWSEPLKTKSDQLAKEGVFVIGVELAVYLKNIQSQEEDCSYLAGEIERLIQSVEKGIGIKSFVPAALTGEGAGSEIAEKIFYQSPESFFGLISTNTEAKLPESIKFCDPDDAEDQTQEAYSDEIKESSASQVEVNEIKTLLAEIPASSGHTISPDLPQGVADLPLEVLLPEDESASLGGSTFAIFLSGDGGWASIDQELSEKLIERNIPVIGVSSLQYFWKKQKPADGAKDLERIIHVYSGLLKRPKVAIFGFSFGADVIPAFVNGLKPEVKAMISKIVLLSPSLLTDYEIHISEWVGFDEIDGGEPILPEVRKLNMPILCLYGESEKDETICAVQKDGVKQENLKLQVLPGDHHFDGEYDEVAKLFLEFIKE